MRLNESLEIIPYVRCPSCNEKQLKITFFVCSGCYHAYVASMDDYKFIANDNLEITGIYCKDCLEKEEK